MLAWFDGFTKDLTTTVWVGYDNNGPMINKNNKGMTGASAAAPIWALYMQKALEEKDRVKFPIPEGIKFATVDARTGYLAKAETKEKIIVGVKEEVNLTEPPPAFPEALSELEMRDFIHVPREEDGLPEL